MFWHREKLTKAKKVENALRSAGVQGITNSALNHITFRYSAYILNLRNDGYKIDTVKIGGNGLYKFYWKEK